jgi:hypothetical protein
LNAIQPCLKEISPLARRKNRHSGSKLQPASVKEVASGDSAQSAPEGESPALAAIRRSGPGNKAERQLGTISMGDLAWKAVMSMNDKHLPEALTPPWGDGYPSCAKCNRLVDSIEVETPFEYLEESPASSILVHTGERIYTVTCHGENWRWSSFTGAL